jgi:hydroxymethylpyrimidine pyrophosphatase-like HAD family hydrolase
MGNLKNKHLYRLIDKWEKHGKIIIAVDYDDTIVNYNLYEFSLYHRIIELLKKCKKIGCYIIIYTSREENRYKEIKEFCESKGLKIDAINEGIINITPNSKLYYNHLLDDKAGLEEAFMILESAYSTIKSILKIK